MQLCLTENIIYIMLHIICSILYFSHFMPENVKKVDFTKMTPKTR